MTNTGDLIHKTASPSCINIDSGTYMTADEVIKGSGKYDDKVPSVSILIPAYNCGKYIEKTLQSIFAQKYSGRIEIVIGYDTKSTDDTLEKIRKISSPYDIIIDSANDSSIGEGRNRLFKFAAGDFVLFMDSDDLITDTLIQNVIGLFTKHPELNVVTYKYKAVSEDRSEKCYTSHCGLEHPESEIMSPADVMHAWWLSEKCTVCAWGYICRRQFLIDNNIVFPNCSHGEDQIFVLKCILSAEKTGFLKMVGYIYIVRENSICTTPKTPEEIWDEHKEYLDAYYKLTADKYPALYSIAFLDFERDYIYRCAQSDYKTFREKLDERYVRNIPVVFGTSLLNTGASLLFNISKRLFWIGVHIRFKFRL